jgi:hypothetical protein
LLILSGAFFFAASGRLSAWVPVLAIFAETVPSKSVGAGIPNGPVLQWKPVELTFSQQ